MRAAMSELPANTMKLLRLLAVDKVAARREVRLLSIQHHTMTVLTTKPALGKKEDGIQGEEQQR